MIVGPRMQISIVMLSQTGGHGDDWYAVGRRRPADGRRTPGRPSGIVDGPDEIRRKVRELHRMGADVIKVATSGGVLSPRDDPRHAHFRPAELEALVEEATAAGMFVMAHAQGADGIKNAVRAGIRSIEHGIYLDDEAIELMLAPRDVARADARRAAGRPRRGRRRASSLPPAVVDKARMVIDIHRAAFRTAVEAGVRIAMGTDSGVDAARPEPARARADGRRRDGAGRGPRGDDPERRPAARRRRRASARSSRASAPTSSWSTATRTTSPGCASGSSRSGRTAVASPERPRATPAPLPPSAMAIAEPAIAADPPRRVPGPDAAIGRALRAGDRASCPVARPGRRSSRRRIRRTSRTAAGSTSATSTATTTATSSATTRR